MEQSQRKYFSRSWAMLTRDKGWIKPLLVLAAAMFVPVVGALGLLGYGLEWARLSAWGIDAAPKQRNVQVGACISAGWRAFVVGFVWWLPVWVILGVVQVPLFPALGITSWYDNSALGLVVSLISLFWALIVIVAQLRTTVYGKISAGLMPHRVFEMVSTDFPHLAKIALIHLVGGLILWAIAMVAFVATIVMAGSRIWDMIYLSNIVGDAAYSDGGALFVSMVLSVLAIGLPVFLIALYVAFVVLSAVNLLSQNSVGLWMRQFDVPRWGGPAEPLPAREGLPEPGPVSKDPSPNHPDETFGEGPITRG